MRTTTEEALRVVIIQAMVDGSRPQTIARKVLQYIEDGKAAYATAKAKDPCAYCECMYPCGAARSRNNRNIYYE